MLTNALAKILIDIARQAVNQAANHKPCTPMPREEQALNERAGCFVTIKKNGQLRGCIGNFQSRKPLYQEVAEMAVAAATQDPRFPPLRASEIADIQLEITVLSPLEKISGPEDIVIGEHGIYLEQGFHRGVLLPQVATEQQWDVITFLEQTCNKAGLDRNAWQLPTTEIYRFRGQIIHQNTELHDSTTSAE